MSSYLIVLLITAGTVMLAAVVNIIGSLWALWRYGQVAYDWYRPRIYIYELAVVIVAVFVMLPLIILALVNPSSPTAVVIDNSIGAIILGVVVLRTVHMVVTWPYGVTDRFGNEIRMFRDLAIVIPNRVTLPAESSATDS